MDDRIKNAIWIAVAVGGLYACNRPDPPKTPAEVAEEAKIDAMVSKTMARIKVAEIDARNGDGFVSDWNCPKRKNVCFFNLNNIGKDKVGTYLEFGRVWLNNHGTFSVTTINGALPDAPSMEDGQDTLSDYFYSLERTRFRK